MMHTVGSDRRRFQRQMIKNPLLCAWVCLFVSSTTSLSLPMAQASSSSRPVVYTIAGSDSGGGAGIQADLHAIHSFGGHGCSAITCLTAQNSVGVTSVHSPPPEFLQAQLDALLTDLPPKAVKIGMLGTKELAIQVGSFLQELKKRKEKVWVVLDPVMISTSGHRLIEEDAQKAMVDHVFPHIDILTPNKFEAEALLDRKLQSIKDIEAGAKDILEMGAPAVLIKGGHTFKRWGRNPVAEDYLLAKDPESETQESRVCDGNLGVWLRSTRYNTKHTHGTGCTLSSSMAAALALGEQERQLKEKRGAYSSIECVDAACLAKAYVTAGIHTGVGLGKGPGPVAQTHFPRSSEHFPAIVRDAEHQEKPFLPMKAHSSDAKDTELRLGRILPIVNNVEWVRKLAALPGVDDIQLRIKGDYDDAQINQIVQECQDICVTSDHPTRLWVNDYWQSAVAAGCFGVHLGQEDLYKCAQAGGLDILRSKGMALGVSIHSFAELSVALGVEPSYVSLGPIFSTKSKKVNFDPQGVALVKHMRELIPPSIPFMVIGGIGDADTAKEMRIAGADSVAVIGAIMDAKDTETAVKELNEAME